MGIVGGVEAIDLEKQQTGVLLELLLALVHQRGYRNPLFQGFQA